MKYVSLLLLCSVLVIFSFPKADGVPDVARVHVIANSDSREDIDLKMKVAASVAELLKNEKFDSVDSIEAGLKKSLPEIIEVAQKTIKSENFSYEAKGEVGVRYFDKKSLSGSTLPEGEYLSLIITLGEGKGHNWWSVIFPDIALGASLAQGEEGSRGKTVFLGNLGIVKIRSLILDIFRY